MYKKKVETSEMGWVKNVGLKGYFHADNVMLERKSSFKSLIKENLVKYNTKEICIHTL